MTTFIQFKYLSNPFTGIGYNEKAPGSLRLHRGENRFHGPIKGNYTAILGPLRGQER